MKIYFVRHGQTAWNAENKVCGVTDLPLTEEGVRQAQKAAQHLKDKDIDLILSSPMTRALQTAREAAKVCGAAVVTDSRLREQDFGEYEGVDRHDVRFKNAKKEFAVRFPKGESIAQVIHRVYSVLDEIRNKYPNKNILIVCHGGVCRAARTYFTDMTAQEYANYSPDNASVTEYEI